MSFVVKLVTDIFQNASRDMRELETLLEMGHHIEVVAKSPDVDKVYMHSNGYLVHELKVRDENARKFEKTIQKIFAIVKLASYIRKLRPDVISCHDLIALFIGYLSTLFLSKQKRPKLVYDAHEYEFGLNTTRSRLTKCLLQKLEYFLMTKSAFSMFVSDSIAEAIQKDYHLKEKPLVVRNTPHYWNLDSSVIDKQRSLFITELKADENCFIAMYHGKIASGRGADELIKATARLNNFYLVVLGMGSQTYIQQLKQLVSDLKIENRVLFYDAVPYKELWKYVGAADIGMTAISNSCLNHYYCLPNKIFENIQSLTPIICSNLLEMSRLIESYKIGLTFDTLNIDSICSSIEKMKTDKDFYLSCKKNLIKAKDELCWEKEKLKLQNAYKKFLLDKSV